MHYNTIIIGAGISGLYIGNHLKDNDFIIFEQKDRIGGRVKSVKYKNITYDTGAVRIQNHHKRMIKLLHELGLENDMFEMECKNKYHLRTKNKNYPYLLTNKLPNKITDDFVSHGIYDRLNDDIKKYKINKNNYTPYQICNKLYGSEFANLFKDAYGYDKEVEEGNLVTFYQNYGKMDSIFYILRNGLSQIINKLYTNIENKVKMEHKLIDYSYKSNKFHLTITHKNKIIKYSCNRLICSIPPEYLDKLKPLDIITNDIQSVQSSNYIRIFAMYPKENGKYWYEDICNITTDSYIRKIIPYNNKDGIIQICYCDGYKAEYWNNILLHDNLEESIMEELKRIFPEKKIPKSTYMMSHYWKRGTYHWKVGSNAKNLFKKMIKPFQDREFYISGDSYSNNQGWMEGAVETAQKVLQCLNKNSRKCGLKNTREDKIMKKKYSIEEVKKHNKVTDGWMVYENKVYNVTSFIKKHPGALAIKKGLGKDATKIFDAVGHSDRARRIMNKYLIGRLL